MPLDQSRMPLAEALTGVLANPPAGFGAPGHNQGAAMPTGTKALLGRRVFRADVLTPKGLDDRTEGALALQRAHEIAAEAWHADFCRFVTGGSTQSLHSVLAAVARPGETVLIAANAHKAERSYAIAAALDAAILPVSVDRRWDVEHGVTPDALAVALDTHRDARAVLVVSPTYYGVTSDVAALAELCHARGVPLIVDAAWGGAFAFCTRLPDDPMTAGADAAVYSAHKTMGALAQGSVIVARGDLVDRQRLWMAYELFETTSPSVPILATLDATRRDHAVDGERLWRNVLDRAGELRRKLARIDGLAVFGRADLPAHADLDESKILVDVAMLGASGYAVDDWLYRHHRISVGLSDARHLLLVVSLGTTAGDVRRIVRALRDLSAQVRAGTAGLPPLGDPPGIATLDAPEMAMAPGDALFAQVEQVRYEEAAGRIAAEMVAPAPPGVPRLVPGQRVTPAIVAWLVGNRDAGAFILDPVDPEERTLRVVAR